MQMMGEPSVAAILLKEPETFFSAHCAALAVGASERAAIEFPNPFGGPPIPGTIVQTLTAHDAAAGTVDMVMDQSMDAEAMKAAAHRVLEQSRPEYVSKESLDGAIASMPPFQVETRSEATYSLADGFPVRLSVARSIGGDDHPQRRTDTWTWIRAQ